MTSEMLVSSTIDPQSAVVAYLFSLPLLSLLWSKDDGTPACGHRVLSLFPSPPLLLSRLNSSTLKEREKETTIRFEKGLLLRWAHAHPKHKQTKKTEKVVGVKPALLERR